MASSWKQKERTLLTKWRLPSCNAAGSTLNQIEARLLTNRKRRVRS